MPQFDERLELVAGSAKTKGRVAQRIDSTTLEHDWYNDYAAFILDLAARMELASPPQERSDIIAKLQGILED